MRYEQIVELVGQVKPASIVEIGVYNGVRAVAMAEEALKHKSEVHYQGFDLFEDATPQTDKEEFNAKKTQSVKQISARLDEFKSKNPGFTYELVKGNTRQTLYPQAVDFAFIDGGHSVETIRSDYEALKDSKFVLFDDYYKRDPAGGIPDLDVFGANLIVDEINHAKVLPSTDKVIHGGIVHLATVDNRKKRGRPKKTVIADPKRFIEEHADEPLEAAEEATPEKPAAREPVLHGVDPYFEA